MLNSKNDNLDYKILYELMVKLFDEMNEFINRGNVREGIWKEEVKTIKLQMKIVEMKNEALNQLLVERNNDDTRL